MNLAWFQNTRMTYKKSTIFYMLAANNWKIKLKKKKKNPVFESIKTMKYLKINLVEVMKGIHIETILKSLLGEIKDLNK